MVSTLKEKVRIFKVVARVNLVSVKCNLSHDESLTFRVTLDSIQKHLQMKHGMMLLNVYLLKLLLFMTKWSWCEDSPARLLSIGWAGQHLIECQQQKFKKQKRTGKSLTRRQEGRLIEMKSLNNTSTFMTLSGRSTPLIIARDPNLHGLLVAVVSSIESWCEIPNQKV